MNKLKKLKDLIKKAFFKEVKIFVPPPASSPENEESSPEPIEYPITDELDLHTFRPKEVRDLLDDYLEACREKEIFSIRIIHGKGKGILKNHVQALLKRHPLVESFSDAPANAGGWGATRVWLRRKVK